MIHDTGVKGEHLFDLIDGVWVVGQGSGGQRVGRRKQGRAAGI